MTGRAPFRAGDVVAHACGETWVLACDEFSGSVWPAGWPETRANVDDCRLVRASTDAERLEMLTKAAAIHGNDYRRTLAASQLEARGAQLDRALAFVERGKR